MQLRRISFVKIGVFIFYAQPNEAKYQLSIKLLSGFDWAMAKKVIPIFKPKQPAASLFIVGYVGRKVPISTKSRILTDTATFFRHIFFQL